MIDVTNLNVVQLVMDFNHPARYTYALWEFFCGCDVEIDIITGEFGPSKPYFCLHHSTLMDP